MVADAGTRDDRSPDAESTNVVDANGVDRAQIRAMLALAPVDRLRRMQEFVASLLQIRDLNEESPNLPLPILEATLDERAKRG